MPTTDTGKAIAARNVTTHGLFARDVVLPHLGEDPAGYQTLADALAQQLAPQNLLEHHYVEKIAAASWRLRRLQRWQAQLYEDDTLTEDERLDRLDKTLRHETALHRQIDTAVKMLAKDVPQLYARRVRARVLEDAMLSERECLECPEDDAAISMEVRNRLGRIRKATDLALPRLVAAPLDTLPRHEAENCQNELASAPSDSSSLSEGEGGGEVPGAEAVGDAENCQNEPAPSPTPHPLLVGEGARHEREGFPVLLPQNWGPGGDPSEDLGQEGSVVEVDPRTHAAFLGMNEVRRVRPHAAAQSHRSARDAEEPYF